MTAMKVMLAVRIIVIIIIIMSSELEDSGKLTIDIFYKNLRASIKFWAPDT